MTVWDSMALNAPHTEREIRSIHETGAGDLPTKLDGFPLLEEAIKEHFGQRCDEYMAGCPCCDTWAELDRLRAIRAAEARELAQDGEPATGSTTEPENATCPSAGGFGGRADDAVPYEVCAISRDELIIIDGKFVFLDDHNRVVAELEDERDTQASLVKCACAYDRPDDLCLGHKRIFDKIAARRMQAILAAIAAEKAEWPHAGSMHDGARMACDAIAARVKQLMGDA